MIAEKRAVFIAVDLKSVNEKNEWKQDTLLDCKIVN